jgi:serine/threonine protein kinase
MADQQQRFEEVARAVCAERELAFGELVGSGAFKHTFRATTAAGALLALKIFKSPSARDAREISALKRCNHSSIARLHDVGTRPLEGVSYTYSLEEFLDGGTLTKRLAGGVFERGHLVDLGTPLIEAVGHIAALDLVHRDLKPDNIMFRAAGTPVVVDFGLVRDLSETSLTKTWAMRGPGSPFFSAPEQLNNDKHLIDWRTDQFGLGVVLTLAGMGRHPYAEPTSSPHDIVDRVAQRQPPSNAFIAWARTNGLDVLVKAVAPWPAKRYRTPADFEQAWRKVR